MHLLIHFQKCHFRKCHSWKCQNQNFLQKWQNCSNNHFWEYISGNDTFESVILESVKIKSVEVDAHCLTVAIMWFLIRRHMFSSSQEKTFLWVNWGKKWKYSRAIGMWSRLLKILHLSLWWFSMSLWWLEWLLGYFPTFSMGLAFFQRYYHCQLVLALSYWVILYSFPSGNSPKIIMWHFMTWR